MLYTPIQAMKAAIAKFELAATVAAAAGNTSLAAASHGAIARAHRAIYWEEKHTNSNDDMATFKKASDAAKAAFEVTD